MIIGVDTKQNGDAICRQNNKTIQIRCFCGMNKKNRVRLAEGNILVELFPFCLHLQCVLSFVILTRQLVGHIRFAFFKYISDELGSSDCYFQILQPSVAMQLVFINRFQGIPCCDINNMQVFSFCLN